jgi:hypothetical protein
MVDFLLGAAFVGMIVIPAIVAMFQHAHTDHSSEY